MVVALLAVAVVAALGSGNDRAGGQGTSRQAAPTTVPPPSTTTTTTKAQAELQLLSDVIVSPVDGATGQSLRTVVTVRASGARLESVKVRPSSGGPGLGGVLDATGDEWHSTGHLLPGSVYVVRYDVVSAAGLNATGSGTFATSAPAETVTASVFPSPGIGVGVGQPIVVTFSSPIDSAAAQQSVLSHLDVAMSKPVPGGWHWFSPVELHFRPASYWPVGEQVEVDGQPRGWDVGGGAWGQGTVSTAFVVGDSHISVVDLATHQMTVTDNGQVVYSWPDKRRLRPNGRPWTAPTSSWTGSPWST